MTSEQERKYRDTLAKASARIKELMAQVNELQGTGRIAVVGIGCRFPGGADSPEAFWKLLADGVDTVTEVPADRWNVDDWYNPDPSAAGKSYTRRGAFLKLDELKRFDAVFFGISPLEAASLDPQQRLLLETAWEAVERSGKDPKSLKGSRTGVFLGVCGSDYAQGGMFSGDTSKINPYSITGVLPSIASGRISYLLDLLGPNISLDTACSSSLVAILLAMKSLLTRDCDTALAGGVNLMLTPGVFVGLSRMNALSADGVCRAFGEHANGFVRGEGCGVLYLKRLEDAERSGDPIIAVLRGGGMNHDGQSNGLTAPNALSQQEVVRSALLQSGVTPDEIDVIETHGTGTPLGDPIEARSLAAVFGSKSELPIGSVKTNIGHLEVAAGVAGAIKAIMMVNRGLLLPSLHAEQLNSHIPWDKIPLRLLQELRPFPDTGRLRAAGVSSFGFSGTNAHLIVQEYRRQDGSGFPLSSHSTFSFQRKPYWIDPMALYQDNISAAAPADASTAGTGEILAAIMQMVTTVSGREASELNPDVNLFELGLDSLMLIQLRDTMNRDYGVTLELSNLMEDANTLNRLASFVAKRVVPPPAHAVRTTTPINPPIAPGSGNEGVEQFFNAQLEQIRALMKQQLDALRQGRCLPPSEKRKINFRATILDDESGRLNDDQRVFVTGLIDRHTTRTAGSKALAQRHRRYQSDWINTLAYRGCLKELVYPIASASSAGARFTDIDGNDYLDLAMGFGVSFFGHSPSFVNEAILERLGRGMELATQIPEAGETAEIFCRLTGMERVTFCNTGSDAVMMALRIARTVTGRERIVIFAGSYHGTTDGVLVFADDSGQVFPTTSGVTFGSVDAVTVLPYGTDESLRAIRGVSGELAAILVEPVQSRRPGFQPVEFLKALRDIADQSGAALIFDEMITGFRTHPGGAQAVFGIQADIATYGKAVGGGMPISMVAGKARFLDAVDGGFWQYGDNSKPEAEVMFFGGTFCRHPLAIASSLAALRHMEQQGPALQEEVNRKTGRLAAELNSFFVREKVPMLVQHFGSLFRFESYGQYALLLQPLEMDLFFYLLMIRGIFTWERRICFLSTAHTDEDVVRIVNAVKESIHELRGGGFTFEGTPPEHSTTPLPQAEEINSSSHFKRKEGMGYDVFPMSSAQKRLYVLSQYAGGERPYHMTGASLLTGQLDLERLQEIFSALTKRHESLRTGFEMREGELVQVVHSSADIEVLFRELPEEEVADAADRFIATFDLAKPPLLRILAIRISPVSHLLLLDGHHIVLDGFSMNILLSEFATLYGGGALESLPTPYRNHVLSQSAYLESAQCSKDEAFWQERLAGELPVLDLPLDFSRPVRQSFDGGIIRFDFDRERTEHLKQFAASKGTTLYMVLLSAWVVLLYRLSGQDDLIIETPSAGRQGPETLGTIGMFAATLPLRFSVDRGVSFASFLKETTVNTFRCFDHEAYPFDLMVEKSGVKPDPSRNPIFDVSFVFEKADDRVLKLPGIITSGYDLPHNTAMFDLTLEAIEEQGMTRLSLEYATGLFRTETIERWKEYYCLLLAEACAKPETPVGTLSFIPAAEREQLLRGGLRSRPKPLAAATVLDLIEDAIRACPDATAMICPLSDDPFGETFVITYRDLGERINATAQALCERYGVVPGDLVGFFAGRSPELLILMYAILRVGAAYVPVDVSYPPERVRHIIKDSGMKLLVTDREVPMAVQTVMMAEMAELAKTVGEVLGEPLPPRPDTDSRAYVIYTSGSTGLPKGCEMTHGNLLNYIEWQVAEYLTDKPFGCFGFATPLSFDLTLTPVFAPLLVGKPIFIYPETMEMDEILTHSLHPDTPIDCLKVTPSHVSMMEHLGVSRTNVALTVVGGEQFTREQIRILESMNPAMRITNEYGPTETTAGCMVADVHSRDERVVIGVPIVEMAMFVLDEQLAPVPFGVKGELCIGGAGLGRGYLNRPELTAEKFVPHPFRPGERIYRSGDIGLLRSDGQFECMGRRDGQVKIRGYRIELGEIEQALLELHGISEAVVIVRNVGVSCELAAFVVGTVCENGDIRRKLSERLPEYMVPPCLVKLERMPVTPNGKVDRKALELLEVAPEVYDPGTEALAPSSGIEREILGIWETVLQRHVASVTDNFFSLGGQSLKAVQVIGRIQKEMGLDIRLRDLFASPTVAELAICARSRGASEQGALRRLPEQKLYDLSHSQKRLWLLDQMECGTAAYNMTGAWLLTGELDVERLRRAVQLLTSRHEILRTTFELASGEPKQRIHEAMEIPFLECDLSGGAEPESEAMRLVRDEGMTQFDLSSGPLLRIQLLRLDPSKSGNRRTVLSFTIHHIISDGWSVAVMIREISALYSGMGAEQFPPLPIQYRDYAAWQHSMLSGPAGKEGKEYWSSVLSGELEQLNLTTDFPRPDRISSRGASIPFRLERELTEKLNQLGVQHKTTLFMTLLAVIKVLLYSRTGQEEITVGSPVAGRDLPELENQIGLYLNTIPLRDRLYKDDPFSALLERIRATVTEAYSYQYYPFDKMLEDRDIEKNLARNPLFDVLFVLQNIADARFVFDDVRVEPFLEGALMSKFDLMFDFQDLSELTGNIEYCSDIYSAETVVVLAVDLAKIIAAVTDNANQTVSELCELLLSDQEVWSRNELLEAARKLDDDF